MLVFLIQEENRKLTEDVGTLHRDKQSLKETSETAQTRINELEALVEKLQVAHFCLFLMNFAMSVPGYLNGMSFPSVGFTLETCA